MAGVGIESENDGNISSEDECRTHGYCQTSSVKA